MLYSSLFSSSCWYILLKWALVLRLHTSVLSLSIRQGKHWLMGNSDINVILSSPLCSLGGWSLCHFIAVSAFLVNSFHITFSPAITTQLWQFFPTFPRSRFKLCSHFLLVHPLRPFPLYSACQAASGSLSLVSLIYALPISFCFRWLFSLCFFHYYPLSISLSYMLIVHINTRPVYINI